MSIKLHKHDLPKGLKFGKRIAIDTETMGLRYGRDGLCVVQISGGDGSAHIIQMDRETYKAPNLKALLNDSKIEKIFHFARFDIAMIKKYLGVDCNPLFCTRTASKLVRTYSDKHGLRELCKEVLNIEINKQQQSSDWGSRTLTDDQLQYAANDVLYLHKLADEMTVRLKREGRYELARKCFDFLPVRAELDLAGWPDVDIFEH